MHNSQKTKLVKSYNKKKDFNLKNQVKKNKANLSILDPNKVANTFSHIQAITVKDNGISVIEVQSMHAFTQAIGYIKFTLRNDFNVMYRGQRVNYNSLKPSLFRGTNTIKGISNKSFSINSYLESSKNRQIFLNNTPEYAHEAILQHYGLNTRWIDLVDNHWIALWFGTQIFFESKDGMSIHCESRNAVNDIKSHYVYVILVAVPKIIHNNTNPGLYFDSDSKLIDLRTCVPSLYLRPHSQHAYLIARNAYHDVEHIEFNNRIAGVIRIDLSIAREWLGTGGLISSHSLFPPPFYDEGYNLLLQKRLPHDKELGTIINFHGSN